MRSVPIKLSFSKVLKKRLVDECVSIQWEQ